MYTALMNGLPIMQPIRLTTPSAVSTRVVGKAVARDRRALDVVDRFDQVVDAEGNRGDQDDAEKLEAGEHVVEGRNRHMKTEVREKAGQICERHAAYWQSRGRWSPTRSRFRPRSRPVPLGRPESSGRRRTSSRG